MYSFHNLFVSAITVISFTINAWHPKAACDVARKWQLTLQDPATPIMEGIINFHSTIMFFLIVIGVFVGWLLFRCLFFYNESKNSSQNIDNFTHSTSLEIVWTLVPAFILLIISFPSFALLYSMDDYDSENPAYTIRVVGHQWYWSYEHDCSVNLGKWTRLAEPKPHDLVTLQLKQLLVEKLKRKISLASEISIACKRIKLLSLLAKTGKLPKEKALTIMIGDLNKMKKVIVKQKARAVLLEKVNTIFRNRVRNDLFFLDILKFRTALPFLVKSKVPVFNDNLGKNNQNIAVVPPKLDLPWTFMICTKVVRNLERPQGAFDSYMIDESDLLPGQYRLLEVDNRLYVPINTDTRVLITSADVLHSWAVPSLGIKIDACPGRMNEATLRINRIGTFYGQCSEICGVNHGFMPIVVNGCSLDKFLAWRKGLADNS